MRKVWLVVPLLILAAMVVAWPWPANPPYRTVDFLQIGYPDGDSTSEGNHSIAGWGPIEPDTHGGGWGSISTDVDPFTDRKARVVWNNTEDDLFEDRGAEFTMTVTKKCNPSVCNRQWLRADWLNIRYLDGQANDDFIVLWKNPGTKSWEVLDVVVTDHQNQNEAWKVRNVHLVGKIPVQYRSGGGKQLTFKIVATGNGWDSRSTYGQVAIDYIWLEQP
ncbi:MAG: hypothetical protein V1645_00025 [archaeon]